jgi:ABC-2 type transport system ATP-binding protein
MELKPIMDVLKHSVPVIEARGLTKCFRIPLKSPGLKGAIKHLIRPCYEEKVAVDKIDLQINAGDSVAYVGPNGAGKSTTLKMLTGVLVPSAGEVRVNGLIPHLQRIENARNIGVVFGQRSQLWWDLPVQESFRLLGDIYAIPAIVFDRNLRTFIDLLDLGPLLSVPCRQLSLGQRMRCDLAASLLHSPAIVYLDEPTIGLDVAVKARIRDFIKDMNREKGVTTLLTSHDLGDIQDICQRIVMIDQGKIVFDGSLLAIKEKFAHERIIHIVLRNSIPEASEMVRGLLFELHPSAIMQKDPYHLSVRLGITTIGMGDVAGRLLSLLPIEDLHIEESSLESIIRQLYEGKLLFEEIV